MLFLAGFLTGGVIVLVGMSCLIAGKRADEKAEEERYNLEHYKNMVDYNKKNFSPEIETKAQKLIMEILADGEEFMKNDGKDDK